MKILKEHSLLDDALDVDIHPAQPVEAAASLSTTDGMGKFVVALQHRASAVSPAIGNAFIDLMLASLGEHRVGRKTYE